MNCFDCAALGELVDAVAVCADCGAALCHHHAHVTARWLTRTMLINRIVLVEPPARTIRCGVCQAARDAAPTMDAAAVRLTSRERIRWSPRPPDASGGGAPAPA